MPQKSPPRAAWAALALVAATVLAYVPALLAGAIWDDGAYLTQNPFLLDLDGLRRIWIPGHTPQYYPAVFTAFWIERRLFGQELFGYHAVNVALHALNALLAWRLMRRLAVPGAWWIGAFFALHPVHVESVAWITERKNVLSGCFYLAAAHAYLRFHDGAGDPRRRRWYAAAFGLFVLALLSKTVACTLPAALVLAWLWRGERITWPKIRPLLPLLAVGLLGASITAVLERTRVGATGADFDFSAPERLLIAANALLFYPRKMLLPWPLIFIYPRWKLDASALASYWPVVVLAAVAAAALLAYRRGARGPLLALAFFAGTLFPALGFFNVYPMRYSFVADHFQYLASLGILALCAGSAAARFPRSAPHAWAGGAALVACGWLTFRQCRDYADERTLWEATARRNPGAWIAHNNLATLAAERGSHAEALARLELATAAADSAGARAQIRLNVGLTLGKLGRHDEALRVFEELQAEGGGMEARLARGLERVGRDAEAEAMYRRALAVGAEPDARLPFALHLLRRGRPEEAVPLLEAYARERPTDPGARMHLSDAYAAAGRLDDALAAAQLAEQHARARGERELLDGIRQRVAQLRGGLPAGR